MAKKRYLTSFVRHPKTQQEIKENLDKFEIPLRNEFAAMVRGRRRYLPTAWDDQFVKHQKSWKYLRREKQYRNKDNCNYSWHEFRYSYHDENRGTALKITDRLTTLGCYWEYLVGGIKWFGPDLFFKRKNHE